MKRFILLLECRDRKGIVARISRFILELDGNIVTADQHTSDPEGGQFFLRVEFCSNRADMESIQRGLDPIAAELEARAQVHDAGRPLKTAILVSKHEHCLAELLYATRMGELNMQVTRIISNHPDLRGAAARAGLPYIELRGGKERMEKTILVETRDADFLILARYMQILSGEFLDAYQRPVINIHHSFLPSFKGAQPYEQAFERGVKVIGATAHFVGRELDEGPIITQLVEPVSHRDSVDDLKRKGRNLERRALVLAVHHFLDRRILLFGKKTIVFT